jgi:hypothetical protein
MFEPVSVDHYGLVRRHIQTFAINSIKTFLFTESLNS